MTQPVGGLRARLIHDNIFYTIKEGLGELGWLGTSLQHETVTVRQDAVKESETIRPNVVSVVVEDDWGYPAEMGSKLTDFTWMFYVDVYAESNAVSLHLAGDIQAILEGRFTNTVSRLGPQIEVYDLTQAYATPVELFSVDVDMVRNDRSRYYSKPYHEFWRIVSFQVTDTYGTEDY